MIPALTTEKIRRGGCQDGNWACTLAEKAPDIVLLDILAADERIDSARRPARSDVPVILLTAMGREKEYVAGLESTPMIHRRR
jgi:DNA-binding response OmpR family regulator